MLSPVWSVTGFTSNPGQDKLAGVGVVAGGMAAKALAGLFHLLQIKLKNGIKRSLGVGRVRPGRKLGFVTFPAALRALVIAPHREAEIRLAVQGHTRRWPE
jgi:hypothetical protein